MKLQLTGAEEDTLRGYLGEWLADFQDEDLQTIYDKLVKAIGEDIEL